MTLCNMSIEAGARAGMIAPDETTFEYLRGKRFAPAGTAWDAALNEWRNLKSDDDAIFDRAVEIDAAKLEPFVTWGTNPGMVVPITSRIPDPADAKTEIDRQAALRALEYMALEPRTNIQDIEIDRAFIGSCTNARLEDLRAAARVVKGYRINPAVNALVVPGSQEVKRAAEREGLHRIFSEAGFEWRDAAVRCASDECRYPSTRTAIAHQQAIVTSKVDRARRSYAFGKSNDGRAPRHRRTFC
jgi:3-isopropylmalate/(R)-2-methylmalate dehydratase large subunit